MFSMSCMVGKKCGMNYILQIEDCHARLHAMESRPLSDETPNISATWKESCKRAIIPDVRYHNFVYICDEQLCVWIAILVSPKNVETINALLVFFSSMSKTHFH